jgi:hypothetical protein
MRIVAEYNYRYAAQILEAVSGVELQELRGTLNNPGNVLDMIQKSGKQRDYSAQIKQWFISQHGWAPEQRCKAVPAMRYDLTKGLVCVEIEIGHQRLVYPDFFEFAADHAKQNIPAGVLVVTATPRSFGHDWHCSLASTKQKINAIAEWLSVPLLVIGVDP